jgi:hypothetical protein
VIVTGRLYSSLVTQQDAFAVTRTGIEGIGKRPLDGTYWLDGRMGQPRGSR